MRSVVGVRFERAGLVYYFDAAGLDVKVDDRIVADQEGKQRIGRVVIAPDQLLINQLKDPIPPITRIATSDDLKLSDIEGVPP